MCRAIARIDQPAFNPVEMSAQSATVNILRATPDPFTSQCCYDGMTPPSRFSQRQMRWAPRPI